MHAPLIDGIIRDLGCGISSRLSAIGQVLGNNSFLTLLNREAGQDLVNLYYPDSRAGSPGLCFDDSAPLPAVVMQFALAALNTT